MQQPRGNWKKQPLNRPDPRSVKFDVDQMLRHPPKPFFEQSKLPNNPKMVMFFVPIHAVPDFEKQYPLIRDPFSKFFARDKRCNSSNIKSSSSELSRGHSLYLQTLEDLKRLNLLALDPKPLRAPASPHQGGSADLYTTCSACSSPLVSSYPSSRPSSSNQPSPSPTPLVTSGRFS